MKLIDIAVFDFPNDTSILEGILSAENIQYFLNRRSHVYIFPGSGGILSVREEDRERAVEIIKEAGFEKYLIND